MKKIFTQFFLFATLFLASTNLTAQTYKDGTWYSLYDANGFNLETKITSFNGVQAYRDVFAPVGGNLTFNWQYSGWIAKSHDTYIYESSDGGSNYSGEKGHISGTGSGTGNVSLSANINKIKFDRPTGNTNTVKYTNIKLPLKKHILLASGDYGTTSVEKKFANSVTINETSSEIVTVKLRSFLTAGNISITSDNPAFYVATSTYAVGANACASANGAAGNMAGGNTLGNINHYDVHIYFHPTSAGTHNGTITLTDGTSKATIKVSGTCNKIAQTITWNDNIANIKTTDNITLNATATTAITYTSSDNSIAEIVGNTLKINKHGKVTITATAAETDIYASATQTKEVTISATTPEVTWPQVAPITYGTPLTLDMLVGGTANVPGNFEFADLSTTLNAGTHNLVVRFIPEDQNIYAIVEGTVPVTINKAAQTITWDFTDQEITVGTTLTLNASATFGEVTFSIEDNGFASLEGNTLTAIKAGTVTITASQAGNDNYAAAESITHTVTVNKATPIITTMPTLASVVYGATLREALTLVGGEATVNGVTVEGEFTFVLPTHADYLDQVPTVGEHTFNITFLPVATECYNEVDTVITLLVTKELQTITWDFADQEVLIGTTLNLNATATSGEVTFSIECEEGVASLEGNTVTALKAGVVTITASVSGNENYEPATVSHVVTVIKHTPTIVALPTVAPVEKGTALNDEMLVGGEANTDGTWTFVDASLNLDFGSNNVAVRFTPSNLDYYTTIDTTIIVDITKKQQTIEWELESTTITIGEEIDLSYVYSTSGGNITFTLDKEGIVKLDTDFMILVAINEGTVTVTATQEGDNEYAPATLSYTINVVDPNSSTTGVTNNNVMNEKSQKIFINGQVYIIKSGIKYNVLGAQVK